MSEMENVKKPVFRELQADDPEPETTEIESLCFNCGENGLTKLLLTKIPFYKEIILMSFECEHCGFKNNEIQSGDKIQAQGHILECSIKEERDMNRQIIKSDYATVKIPELDFEIPPQEKQGQITTVEGILDRCIAGLEQEQPLRRALDAEAADKIDLFVQQLREKRQLKSTFTIIIDDPSGNSFIENLNAPQVDPALNSTTYERNKEQNHLVGIYDEELHAIAENTELSGEVLENEVLQFGTNCPSCNTPCETNMKVTNIPYFKECIIMATNCDSCGHRTNEVKSGSGIGDKGTRITLKVTDISDMSRDVLKSETCSLSIPELDFEVGAGTLGGRFTTLEGLLVAMKEQLIGQNPLSCGDSATADMKERMKKFSHKLEDVISGEWLGVHIVLDDPAGNSYLQNIYAPDPDPEMQTEHYERTFDQNEDLGLNDLRVENYQEDTTND
nr:EOG090X06TU [Sida crystallina]